MNLANPKTCLEKKLPLVCAARALPFAATRHSRQHRRPAGKRACILLGSGAASVAMGMYHSTSGKRGFGPHVVPARKHFTRDQARAVLSAEDELRSAPETQARCVGG